MSNIPYTYSAIQAKHGILVWAAYKELVSCYVTGNIELYENAIVEIAVLLGNSAEALKLITVAHNHAIQVQNEMRAASRSYYD